MKAIKVLLLSVAMLFAAGCDNDDRPKSRLEGSWKLIKTVGGIAGEHNDFAAGMITWSFDSDAQTITIVNNNPDVNAYDLFDTGVYDYTIEPNLTTEFCAEVLVIGSGEQGCYMISGNELTIDEQISDGYMLKLIR